MIEIDLNQIDYEKLLKIFRISKINSDVLSMYANYLIKHPCFITKELVEDIVSDCHVSAEYAFFVLLAAVCGLDMENDNRDKEIAEHYFTPAIKHLNAKDYYDNPYYKNIRIPEVKYGNWELKYEKYQPYEAFIYNDLIVDKETREIPRLGFFDQEFLFPAVLEDSNEWMTITPNEIATMQPAVDVVKGKVITFGLGLGYYAYMVSEKDQVQSITVVEKDEEVIKLFEKYILPQFPHREKIRIISMDAFEYTKKHMVAEQYDYAFVDLWHDVSDGVDLYISMKKLEYLNPKTKYLYWIEESLLSNIRWYVMAVFNDAVEMNAADRYTVEKSVTNDGDIGTARELSNKIQKAEKYRKMESMIDELGFTSDDANQKYRAVSMYFQNHKIKSIDEFIYYLSNQFLRKLAEKL